MPKIPGVNHLDAIRVLEKAGFRIVRQGKHVGFEERVRGSHHMFRKSGVEEKVNLQREGSKAKVYQSARSEMFC